MKDFEIYMGPGFGCFPLSSGIIIMMLKISIGFEQIKYIYLKKIKKMVWTFTLPKIDVLFFKNIIDILFSNSWLCCLKKQRCWRVRPWEEVILPNLPVKFQHMELGLVNRPVIGIFIILNLLVSGMLLALAAEVERGPSVILFWSFFVSLCFQS